jgi:hypothetical protein
VCTWVVRAGESIRLAIVAIIVAPAVVDAVVKELFCNEFLCLTESCMLARGRSASRVCSSSTCRAMEC